MVRLLAMVALALAGWGGPALAQISGDGGPIRIRADRTEYFDTQGISRWIGGVIVSQGQSALHAEEVDIFFDAAQEGADPAQSRKIVRIEARGGVAYIRPTETARADMGVYVAETGLLRLTGTVSLTRERDTLTGESLLYDPVAGEVVVDAEETGSSVRGQFELGGG